MTLSEYIKRLQALEENHGHLDVVMTQSGYYADGILAELYQYPEIKTVAGKQPVKTGEKNWQDIPINMKAIVLGHSHQSY